ncbi:MAG: copper-binding protein [Burkholderiales bacterium]|nr:copper-binding protein [Burkholderiales bacterium]MDE1927800.1 copper-binding protein [Burkholderiales bacterium]MDE2160280.1 copper-binding protein [Burkholderiales bacterium]MDE2503767.1 copper-binding protein [Burkholderiales bacterium]
MNRRQAWTRLLFATIALPLAGRAQTTTTAGEIVKVDKAARRLTIKHEGLPNLGMPAMTMTFDVRDAGLLDDLAVGDKVRFAAAKVDGRYTVVALSKAP